MAEDDAAEQREVTEFDRIEDAITSGRPVAGAPAGMARCPGRPRLPYTVMFRSRMRRP